jgi:hypothetical protein
MKQLRLIVFVLLAVSATGVWAQDKSPTVLLQEGLYSEETEGNLEKAMGIYKTLLKQAGEIQRIAAKATYRLGMCHLKKGEKEQAAAYFQRLVSNYPTQKKLVSQAREQLKKITQATAGAKYVFGPVIERILNDDGVGEDFMFDLDAGKFLSLLDARNWIAASDASKSKGLEEFMMEGVVDLCGDTSRKNIIGVDIIAMPTHNERWGMSPEDVIEQVSTGKPGTPVALSADGELPKTFVFKTEQGGVGVLQITDMQAEKKPRHFKIRYKMLQKEKAKIETARTIVESFLSASLVGKTGAAIKLVKPGSAVVRQVADLHEMGQGQQLQITTVHGNGKMALAFSTEFTADRDRKGVLEIRLIKQRGVWMVEDIDLETPAKAKADLLGFLKKHTDAKELKDQ